jgi:hypothetical protein
MMMNQDYDENSINIVFNRIIEFKKKKLKLLRIKEREKLLCKVWSPKEEALQNERIQKEEELDLIVSDAEMLKDCFNKGVNIQNIGKSCNWIRYFSLHQQNL